MARELGARERIPAIGFALGVERLLMLLGDREVAAPSVPVFLAVSSPRFAEEAFRWKVRLARRGIRAEMDYEGRSLRGQFKRADRVGARFAVVFGEAEEARDAVALKDLARGEQRVIGKSEALEEIARRVGEA